MSANHSLKVVISAGELSGDEHASLLCAALKSLEPTVQIRGMGGRNLRKVGVDTVVDSEHSASVMGIQEVIGGLKGIIQANRTLVRLLKQWRPDVLILVDFPDFNFFLARAAKKLGIKTFYFIPPQIWAWRAGRVRTVERCIDMAAVIFPFERSFYESRGYHRCFYVGNPSVEHVAREARSLPTSAEFRSKHNLDPSRPLLALFPGSRSSEVERHTPILLEMFHLLKARLPEVQAVFGIAETMKSLPLPERLPTDLSCIRAEPLALLKSADAGLLKSGTSNLHAALCNLPFAMFYHAPPLTEAIARLLIPVRTFSIVNHIRPDTVQELLQQEANPQALADVAYTLLTDQRKRSQLFDALHEVRDNLSSCDPLPLFEGCHTSSERAARLVHSLLLQR